MKTGSRDDLTIDNKSNRSERRPSLGNINDKGYGPYENNKEK